MARPVIHILYSGLGGQASVGLAIAKAGHASIPQAIAFHGVEPVHANNSHKADTANIPWKGFLKSHGLSKTSKTAMAQWMCELNPRAIIAHSPAALFCARKVRKRTADCRIIAVEHHSNALKNLQKWGLSAACFLLADKVVYLSEIYRQEVATKLGPLFRQAKTQVIPNGIDLSEYPVPTLARKAGLVGMQGRFVAGKDFPTLLRGIAHANTLEGPPVKLELAGDGPRRQEFEELAAELKLQNQVRFLGLLPAEQLRERLSQWQLYAHATEGETMSLAIMEAKAAGLPVVASDVAGVTPWIRHGQDGILVPGKDATALGAAIRKLTNAPNTAASMGAAGALLAHEEYGIDKTWLAYASLL